MKDLLRKRKAVEVKALEEWLTYGPRYFVFRHERILRPLIEYTLRATGLFGRGTRNALNPVVRHLPVAFASLPPAFCGYRILHLTDLHIDGALGLPEAIAERLAPLEADLCALTGDYRFATTGTCHNVYPGMRKIVAAIRARDGIFGVLGNHDYAEEIPEFEAMGIRILMNAAVEIRRGGESLWLAGIDDAWDYHCADLPRALAATPADGFRILLAHSPDTIGAAAASGVRLYLCGHTHAGQIRLPLIGAVTAPANCPRRFLQGRWQEGGMEGFTGAGVGCSLLAVRFLCPPEIAILELRCAAHATGMVTCRSGSGYDGEAGKL